MLRHNSVAETPSQYRWSFVGEKAVRVKSSVLKRSIVVAGHKTSVSLEDKFWDSLKEIARQRAQHTVDF